MGNNRKLKIIILSVLFAIMAVLLGLSIYARATRIDRTTNRVEAEAATVMAASPMLWESGEDDGGISVMAASSPSLQLTKNSHSTYISSGSYVNGMWGAIMYDADMIRLREVNGEEYDYTPSADRLGFSRSVNGWYSMWAVKKGFLGIKTYSGEYKIALDTVKPVMTAYANGATVSNNSTVRHTITYSATDDFSGVQYYYFSLNGASYVSGGPSAILSADGLYKLYCVDYAGNSSSVINVTKDGTAPTVRAYSSSSSQLSSGAVINTASVSFEASDATTGVDGIYIRTPGVSYYTHYVGSSVTMTAEGTYYYYAKDKAGNETLIYSVTIDRTVPTAQLYSGGSAVNSGYYSASSYIYFTSSDANSRTCYMKKDSGSYSVYSSGSTITAEGKYTFYAIDAASNRTSDYIIYLDRTAPVGTLYAATTAVSSGKITNASYITYQASDNIELSAVYVRQPGSSSYVSFPVGTQFIADGTYYFYAVDRAGNVSATVTILLDKTKPVVTIKGGSTTLASGGYTNSNAVKFSVTDAGSGVSSMYVRVPGSSSYISYVAGTPFSAEGTYYFYAYDVVGNYSDTVSVTIDTTKPTGSLYANGSLVSSGAFTNKSFYYIGSDNLSGVSKYEIKKPDGVWETYTGTTIAATSANGLYYFRTTDRAGNVSAESQITLITAAPSVSVYSGTTTVPSGSYTNKSYVAFTAAASGTATASLYAKIPDSSGYISYVSGTPLYREGIYYFYASDNAGNVSGIVNITLDTTAPVGAITSDGESVVNGSYVNTAFKYSATDNVSGIARYEIMRPGQSWETYSGGEIAVGSGNGWYTFRAIDNAGNVSGESKVNLLTAAPTVQLYANEQPVGNGTHTTAARISMSASGGTSVTCYVKLPRAQDYIAYNQYFIYTAPGRYEFYAEDAAGNRSGSFAIIIDRMSKPVTLNGITDGVASGDASVTWSNDASGNTAPIVSVTINGVPYSNGSVIHTIDGGEYYIESIDAAGNTWNTSFTAKRKDVVSETLNKIYFESTDGTADGTVAFSSYDNALAFAKEREAAFVRTGTWSGAVWDVGIPMDSIDSVNAKNGSFYIYKKSGDKNIEVAYFTLERLNAVIFEYAAATVKSYYYWQKTPVAAAQGEDLYGLKDGRVFIGISITLGSHANYLIDGVPYSGLTYSVEGLHTLTVYDDYGNSYEYALKITRSAPAVKYMVAGGGVFNTATAARQYRLTKAVTVKITDGIDDYAMYIVADSTGKIIAILSLGDEYVINKSGQYTVKGINHFGESEEIVFVLSLSAPNAVFTENEQSKRLELNIQGSLDENAAITSIGVYRSTDGGQTWTQLTADDYGHAITISRLTYEFYRNGIYKAVIEDSFRSGLDTVTAIKEYVKPAPAGTLSGVIDGGSTNGTVRFEWTDEAKARLTVNGSTTDYLSGTAITAEGEYALAFYDDNGYTRVYTFIIDTTAPIGTAGIQSGGYINTAFCYSASDNLSGISRMEIKKPGKSWETYDGRELTAGSGDGWYSFRVYDNAGNLSDEYTICLITVPPVGTVYAGTAAVADGTYTNSGYIMFEATGTQHDITIMYVKEPGASSYAIYTAETKLTAEGTYYFYAVDLAGNVSETVSVTLDLSKPSGGLTAGGANVQSGSYTNKAFKYAATDSVSGVFRMEIKRPNGTWEMYNGGEITAASGDGWYYFRAIDRAGNVSAESKIYLLTTAPIVQLYANEIAVTNGTYTNLARISMSAGGVATTCYVRLPGADNFIAYSQYFTYSSAGRYEFYAEDEAGNRSETFAVIIDRAAKAVSLNGVSGGNAAGNVTITWENGDAMTDAPIVNVTVNGINYVKGNAIRTIDGGVYFIESTDAAGNVWTATFTATRTDVISETLNKEFWEAKDRSGNAYAFASYENAFAFAAARENALVRTATWSGNTWNGGIPMDSIDSANAKNGQYYIYKKSGDKNTEVAYFTLERLNAVIAEYAAESVSSFYWWQRTPAAAHDGNELYALKADRIFVGNSVTLSSHANYYIDGVPYHELIYSAEGEHVLTVYDDYGNNYEYKIVIVKTVPNIVYKLANGVWNTASSDRQYMFNSSVTVGIEDVLGGDYAMYIIKSSAGEVMAIVSCGDGYTLDKSGRYTVYAVNHGGTGAEITFILSLDPPVITVTENADSKRLEIKIKPSADSGTAISTIKIYKSLDGKTWTLLEKDSYSRAIALSGLFYEFNLDGLYKVVVEDNFRSGLDAVAVEHEYKKPAPEGTLTGVTDGGYTNTAVRFTWSDEAEARLIFNGKNAEYLSGTDITAEGEYTLEFLDGNGYKAVYTFTIDKTAPAGTLNGAGENGLTYMPVTLAFSADGVTGKLFKGGEFVGEYVSGAVVEADGEYKIVLADRANNTAEYVFIIDTVKPGATLSGVENGGKSGGNVALKNPNKQVEVKAYINGTEFSYEFGDTISKEGSYRFVLTDKAGNVTEYSFEIVYAVNAAGTIVLLIVIFGVFGGIAVVYIMRKRKVFKSKTKKAK